MKRLNVISYGCKVCFLKVRGTGI